MKKLLFISFLTCFTLITSFSQTTIKPKLVLSEHTPKIDGIKDAVYNESAIGYVMHPGNPNFGDLYYPDLELKFYTLWHDSALFLLFRHSDDILVTAEQDDGSVKDGLENRDATTLFLYLGRDSARFENVLEPDTLTFWLTWTWKTNLVEARLSDGTIATSYEAFYTQCVQRYDEDEKVWNAEMVIDLNKLSISGGRKKFKVGSNEGKVDSTDFENNFIGFDIELDENDKEIGTAPFGLQTRSFFGDNLWDNAKEKPSQWAVLKFSADTAILTPIHKINLLSGISVYPNPVSSNIVVETQENETFIGRIMDNSGRVLREFLVENKMQTLNLEELDFGLYILQLISEDNRVYSQILIKQ